jgi:hypothetical protein
MILGQKETSNDPDCYGAWFSTAPPKTFRDQYLKFGDYRFLTHPYQFTFTSLRHSA